MFPSIDQILPSLQSFGVFGYWLIGLASALEAFFLTGVIVPGTLIVDAGGLLVQQGLMDFLDLVVRETMFWRHRPAGPFTADDLSGYREPVLLVTAGRDPLFPPAATRVNARAALNIAEEIELPDSLHMPDPALMTAPQERIAAFLAD